MWAKDGPSNGSPDLEKNNSKQHGICIKINHLCGGFWESLIFSHTQINTKKVFASPRCFLIVLASRHDESFGIVSLFYRQLAQTSGRFPDDTNLPDTNLQKSFRSWERRGTSNTCFPDGLGTGHGLQGGRFGWGNDGNVKLELRWRLILFGNVKWWALMQDNILWMCTMFAAHTSFLESNY